MDDSDSRHPDAPAAVDRSMGERLDALVGEALDEISARLRAMGEDADARLVEGRWVSRARVRWQYRRRRWTGWFQLLELAVLGLMGLAGVQFLLGVLTLMIGPLQR
ncbi:MAG: hypothetical protein H6983_17445 [Ectothiorhodospiraceae bacterium]|nr:hypothetical protein [Chromatiales bacterium]MCP5155960.1 hypothetical protein [Ectothiorhodospiraceae bacterium]